MIELLVVGAVMFGAGVAVALIILTNPPTWYRRLHGKKNARSVALADRLPTTQEKLTASAEPVYVVLAANYQVADAWRMRSKLPVRQVRYVTAARDLRGWGEGCTVVMLEGWSANRSMDAVIEVHDAIRTLVATRGVKVLSGQEWEASREAAQRPA